MEMVIGVETIDEGIIEDGAADKLSSGLAPLKQVADPIVYKLVRVDFDGKFVPATDDELMEVENLLELEKNEIVSMPDVMEAGLVLDKDDSFEKPLLEKHEGLSQIKVAEVDEENLRTQAEDSLPISTSSSKDRHVKGSNTGEESSSSLRDGLSKSRLASSQPNFSLIKGEINLDNLTTRELHETFRATFGRRTSVKDKLWLKRRIAMGLTNSCDVSVSSFIINDGKLLKKTEELRKNMACEDLVAGEICNAVDDKPVLCPNLRDDMADKTEVKSPTESCCRSDDNLDNRAAKRVRKPTKRYIEEISDKEKDSGVKAVPSSKHFGEEKVFLKETVRPAWGVHSGDFVTRPDSIGGSGVQIPYVSRIRRCRPRKSITSLTEVNSSDVTLAWKVIETSVAVSKTEPDEHSSVKSVKIKSFPCEDPIATDEKREKQCLSSTSDVSQARDPKSVDSEDNLLLANALGDNSDDHVTSVPTANGGMRRKHHRAWSLTEVMKLVDGVAKFGVGRWSEIKRLSFSSYSHRTPVDLKDKWRNLLKASSANAQADKGVNPRKNAPPPIPSTILVKVRELAEINGQGPQAVKGSSNNSGSTVNENKSGCL